MPIVFDEYTISAVFVEADISTGYFLFLLRV
jgi:hypothetical protein